MVALKGTTTINVVVGFVDSTIGSIALANQTVGLATVSALMLNIDVESRFSAEGVKSVENMRSKIEFDGRFFNDLIAGLRLCFFNTVCCIC